ncbi:MAG: glycosyltransferase family 2 protein [Metallosphaera sp.]
MQILSDIYEKFTVNYYNDAIKEIKGTAGKEFALMLLSSPATALLFPNWRFKTIFDLMKLGWYVALPKVGEFGASKLITERSNSVIDPSAIKGFKSDRIVINQVVTSGKNVRTVERTVRSIRYWYKEVERKYSVKVPYEVWIVTDEGMEGRLKGLNSVLKVVPRCYETKNGSTFKARALQYAMEEKEKDPNDWVYYHDEETMFGEDSVLGLAEFMRGDLDIGVHTITYPVNWKMNVLSVIETMRTSNDIISLSLSPRGVWHGSGFMAKVKVEKEIGWDFGPVRAEDLLFHLNAAKKFRYGLMKGFVYEIPPQNLIDYFKQRRRWVLGILDALGKMSLKDKIKYALNLVSWYSSALGFLAPFFILIKDAAAPLPIGPYLTGPIWLTLMLMLKDGFVSTRRYVDLSWRSFPTFMAKGIIGLMLESIAPWYALTTGWKEKGFHVIDKD